MGGSLFCGGAEARRDEVLGWGGEERGVGGAG